MKEFIDVRYQRIRRDRQEMLDHLNKFSLELKVSVGIWYFAPGGGRFHERYTKDLSIEERLELAAEMAKYGVKGIEAHYPYEVNEENIHLYKKLEEQAGIRLLSIGPWIFHDKDFEFGSLSNPIDKARDKAIDMLVRCLRFVKDHGLSHCGVWPGIDGYLYSLGSDYYHMWDRFEEAVALAMDEVPGVRVAIEPKPYEPAPNNIYRTTSDGILAALDIEKRLRSKANQLILEEGHALVGMQPEIGHIRMGFEDTPYAFARAARAGRLFHTHWNSQPLGNYDQDLNVGVVEIQQAEAALYLLKMAGYREYMGIDINPERMPTLKAVEINCRMLEILNERIDQMDHEKILACYYDPENHRGDLEMLLAQTYRRGK